MVISKAFEMFMLEEKLNGRTEKTYRNYSSVLNNILRSIGDIPIELVNHTVVMNWKMAMDYQGLQSSTIASNLCKLRQVLKYMKRHGYEVTDYRDIDLPVIKQKETEYVTPDETTKMINATENIRDKAILATLWATGARISEVLALNREDIEKEKAHVIGKNSKLITIHFDKRSRDLINDYLETRHDKLPYMFISGQMRRITVQRVEQIVNQIAGECGIEKRVTPHTFRHGFATDLLENGADIRDVQAQLHHTSINTTQRYTHIVDRRKDEIYNKYHSI